MLAPCAFDQPQGTPVFIRAHANVLAASGHRAHVLSYPSVAPARADDAFVWHRRHGPPPSARSGPHPRRIAADVQLAQMALVLARDLRPAVIWAHQPEGLAIALWLRARLRTPVVFHSHAMLAEELPTYAARGRRLCRALGRAVDTALPRCADATICFEAGHARALRAAGVPPARLHVIPPGVLPWPALPPTAPPCQAWPAEASPRLLYSGNFDGYQNLPLLLAALPLIRRALPAAHLLLATHHPARLERLPPGAATYQVRDLAEMALLFTAADVAVCPRVLHAGVPVKLLNSRAAGLPVVTCCPAARRLLDTDGTTVTPATPEAIAAAVVRVCCDAGRNHRRGAMPAIADYDVAYDAVLAAVR